MAVDKVEIVRWEGEPIQILSNSYKRQHRYLHTLYSDHRPGDTRYLAPRRVALKGLYRRQGSITFVSECGNKWRQNVEVKEAVLYSFESGRNALLRPDAPRQRHRPTLHIHIRSRVPSSAYSTEETQIDHQKPF